MVGVGEGYIPYNLFLSLPNIRKKFIEIGRVVSEECDNKYRNKVLNNNLEVLNII